MAQETHLFSVSRPRQTLGAINYNTNIPQPASTLKRPGSISNLRESLLQPPHTAHHGRSQSSSRMSLAPSRPPQPNFTRSSSGTNFPDLGRSVQRSSFNNRMSYAPGGATTPHMQPPMSASQSMQRRSSVYSRPSTGAPMMGQQSFFVQTPLPAGVPTDRRKLRDRGVQNQMATELEEYLASNNFQMEMKHALSPNSMRSPTQKDFNMIFQWLYKRIDPAYQFQKSIDNEVPPILKQLRYPFEKSITKSQLTAVGGQNWYIFLGMLHWLMQLALMVERFSEDKYDYACAEEGVDVSGDKIVFRFLSGAYQTWLSCPPGEDEEGGDDEDEAAKVLRPHIEAMAAEFEQGSSQYSEELKVLKGENAALRKQIQEAEQEAPDLEKLHEHFKILESDLKKFEEYNTSVAEKLKRYGERNKALQSEVESRDKQVDEVIQEKAALQKAVDEQGISITDIDRMNGERERLQNGVEAVKIRLDEMSHKVKENEAEASDKLSNLEGLVRQYNSLCYDVGIRETEFELAVKTSNNSFSSSQLGSSRGAGDRLLADSETGYHPARILNLDMRGKVKGYISSIRKEADRRRAAAKDQDEENRRFLFDISAAIDDRRHEVEALKHKVNTAKEEFNKIKEETTTQKNHSDAQIEKMEKELAKMRGGLTESVQLMEQREMNTNIEYEQLTVRANSLREELHTEIERMLNDIIKFKVHIQGSLEAYETFVDDELEQELAIDDPMVEAVEKVEEE